MNRESNILGRLFNLVSHPAFLALPLLIFLSIFVPISVSKYKIEWVSSRLDQHEYEEAVYEDLDGDGVAERIEFQTYTTNANILVKSARGTILNTFNLPGFWYGNPDYFLGDANGDGLLECYGLSLDRDDSLFVSRIPVAGQDEAPKHRFVTQLKRHHDTLDHLIIARGLLDVTGDHTPEFVFFVNAGFSLEPRAYFAWGAREDTLIQSPPSGMYFSSHSQVLMPMGMMGDQPLVYLSSVGTNNNHEGFPYPDTASYAVVLGKDLQFLFDPIPCGGAQSRTTTLPFTHLGEAGILAITYDPRMENHRMTCQFLDYSGQVRARRDSLPVNGPHYLLQEENQVHVLSREAGNTRLFLLNGHFKLEEIQEVQGSWTPVHRGNLDLDAEEEWVLYNLELHAIGILDEGQRRFSRCELPAGTKRMTRVSLVQSSAEQSELALQALGSESIVVYGKNRLYHFRFMYYLFLYLLSVAILYGLQQLFLTRMRKARALEEKVINLQLQATMNQLNPHFTFNAINSIGHAIVMGKKEEAYQYFIHLSELIRKSMLNAFESHTSLEDELDFVRQYLSIEAYRFGDRLRWTIRVDPDVDQSVRIPKMLIHLFAENAIKHGIFHLKGVGMLEISVHATLLGILIMVVDNGVGFQKAYEIEKKKGKGLEILDNYLNIFNKRNKQHISYKIVEHPSAGSGSHGTRVLITIKI